MANFNARRAPNFSQYLDDLNAIPSPYDQAVQQRQQENSFNLDEELALFTNTEFFDFDNFTDLSLPTFDAGEPKSSPIESNLDNQPAQNGDMKFLDFLQDGFNNVPHYQQDLGLEAQVPVHPAPYTAVPQLPTAPAPTHSAPAQHLPVLAPPQAAAPTPSQTAMSPSPSGASVKRKSSTKATPANSEEAARIMAEEDKRRRNTAASARFRVKKKMREQALERSLKETNDKNDALEARVSQLELENHWLRGLIMEKNGTEERNEASEKAISDMFKKFLASRKTDASLPQPKHNMASTV
ncbi:Regulatory protein cys-3 [Penicillium diatomitis]|uniref:Regulatory protein cys-3 n=1 Tax=Penicillium diatomitis TaxID=2819901 RepID=A0A9X0BTP4_9EURO|nr:Regulatory protein cys-3 [Penicillium diatomitis]KAJ5483863.1 Regulatory protein cys-3 [Penicillium diatomitis]